MSFIPNREGMAVRVSLELMEVTGVSFHMWKVNGGTRKTGAERVSFHMWEDNGGTRQ